MKLLPDPKGVTETAIDCISHLTRGNMNITHTNASLPRSHRPWWDTVEDMLLNTLIALGKKERKSDIAFSQWDRVRGRLVTLVDNDPTNHENYS